MYRPGCHMSHFILISFKNMNYIMYCVPWYVDCGKYKTRSLVTTECVPPSLFGSPFQSFGGIEHIKFCFYSPTIDASAIVYSLHLCFITCILLYSSTSTLRT